MLNKINPGDVVVSTAGRDKDNIFLVVEVKDKFVYLADGKVRKVQNQKKKSAKHIKVILPNGLNDLSEKIKRGEQVGNERLYRLLSNKKI